jgi:hypothetical protein
VTYDKIGRLVPTSAVTGGTSTRSRQIQQVREVAAVMGDEAPVARLASIKSVGHWTVEMLLMYSLERRDILPADDFGIREGYRVLKSLDAQPKPRELREIGLAWSPHRAVAALYLRRIPHVRAGMYWNSHHGTPEPRHPLCRDCRDPPARPVHR